MYCLYRKTNKNIRIQLFIHQELSVAKKYTKTYFDAQNKSK